jgi:hypothetical protein
MKFQSGKSGNPSGRPKGSGTRQQLYNSLITPSIEALLSKALELALQGNETMLRFFLERALPAKAIYHHLKIMGDTASDSINNLINYVAAGELTADDAGKLAAIIYKDAEINNQVVMIEKLKNLEEKLYRKSGF